MTRNSVVVPAKWFLACVKTFVKEMNETSASMMSGGHASTTEDRTRRRERIASEPRNARPLGRELPKANGRERSGSSVVFACPCITSKMSVFSWSSMRGSWRRGETIWLVPFSMAMTFLAPWSRAYFVKPPVEEPISKTILSLKSKLKALAALLILH